MTEHLYVDDTAAVCTTRESIEKAVHILKGISLRAETNTSIPNTMFFNDGGDEENIQPFCIRGGGIEAMTVFRY